MATNPAPPIAECSSNHAAAAASSRSASSVKRTCFTAAGIVRGARRRRPQPGSLACVLRRDPSRAASPRRPTPSPTPHRARGCPGAPPGRAPDPRGEGRAPPAGPSRWPCAEYALRGAEVLSEELDLDLLAGEVELRIRDHVR